MKKIFKLDLLTTVVFILILISNMISRIADIPVLRVATKYTLVAFLVWLFISILIRKGLTKKGIRLFFPLILFNVVYVINMESLSDTEAFFIVLNHLIFFILIYSLKNIEWSKHQIKYFSVLYFISIPILFILSFVVTDVVNRNTIGSYAFFLTFFPLLYMIGYSKGLKRSSVLLVFILSGIVILSVDSRSILLSIIFVSFTYFMWRIITESKLLFNLYFLMVAAFGYWFTFVYPTIYTWNSYYKLNELSLKFVNKPLLTGRERIWERLIGYIEQKPLLGYGSSTLPSDFTTTTLSAHNTYIQVGLQTGIIGIVLLALVFFTFWRSSWENRHDKKVALSASFLIGIIVYQLFEVNLTQSNFGLGLVQWMLIGFLLSFSYKNNIKDT